MQLSQSRSRPRESSTSLLAFNNPRCCAHIGSKTYRGGEVERRLSQLVEDEIRRNLHENIASRRSVRGQERRSGSRSYPTNRMLTAV